MFSFVDTHRLRGTLGASARTCRARRHWASLRRPLLEQLEDRLVPAVHTWTGLGASGISDIWSNNANWDIGAPSPQELNVDLVFPRVPPGGDTYLYDDIHNLVVNTMTFVGNYSVTINSYASDIDLLTGITTGPSASCTLYGGVLYIADAPQPVQLNTAARGGISIYSGVYDNFFGVGLAVNGPGEVYLGTANTYSGGTVVGAGSSLMVANSSALGSNLVTMEAQSTLYGANVALANPFDIEGQGSSVSVYSNGSGNLVLNGAIFGSASLALTGPSPVELSANNTYRGATLIYQGQLALFGAQSLPYGTDLYIGPNASLQTNGYSVTVGALSGAGVVDLLNGNSITVGTDNQSSFFSGLIFSPPPNPPNGLPCGFGAFVKVGTGTLTVDGSGTFEYLGPAAVQGGTLQLDVQLTPFVTPVTVNPGATISGRGAVVGSLTTSGAVSPGDLVGVLTVAGAATFQAGSALNVSLYGTLAGDYTQLATGSANLSAGPALNVFLGFVPPVGTAFTIVTANSLTGTFAGLPNGAFFFVNGTPFTISYTATTAVLTAVANPAPIISTLSSVTEGSGPGTLTVTGSGFNSSTTAFLNGVPEPVASVSATQIQIGTPNLADEGAFTLTLTNPGPGGGTATKTLTVADAHLTTLKRTITPTEGATFTGVVASFTDPAPEAPGSYTVLINWGDSNSSAATVQPYSGTFLALGSHTYGEEGTYSIVTTIMDEGGSTANVTSTANVADAPLHVLNRSVTFQEGAASSGIVAAFTDPDPHAFATQYSASIAWGDGTTTAGAAAGDGAGFDTTGSHAYAEEGTFNVTVTIQDAGGTVATANSTVHVSDAPLTLTGRSLTVTGNKNFSGAVATFTDADASGTVGDYTATITWDDGTTSSGTITGTGPFTVSGSHIFGAFSGTHTISIHVTDAGGSTATVSDSVVDPTLSPNEIFVSQLYRDLLGRPADAGGLAGWSSALDQGAARSTVALDIEASADYKAVVVRGLYASLLGRQAAEAEVRSWASVLEDGATVEQVKAAFLNSAEYFQRAGGTDAGIIAGLYHDVLSRAGDAAGLAAWQAALAGGQSRATLAMLFLSSVEYRRDTVAADYQHFLGRAPDAGGLAAFAGLLQQGTSDEQVAAWIAGSEEYFARAQALP
jgi:autotransporter-associated beta strand protein